VQSVHPYGNKDDNDFYRAVGEAIVKYQCLIMMCSNGYYCRLHKEGSAEYGHDLSLLGRITLQWQIVEQRTREKFSKLHSVLYGDNSKDNNVIDGYICSLPRTKKEKIKIKDALHSLRAIRNALCHADFRFTDRGVYAVTNILDANNKDNYMADTSKVRRLAKEDIDKFKWCCEKMYYLCHDAEKTKTTLPAEYFIRLCDEIISFRQKTERLKYSLT